MNIYMNRVALATFSFFDAGKKLSDQTEPERFYHGFVLGLMVDLADSYVITSNRESGFGRYDKLLWKRGVTALVQGRIPREHIRKYGFAFRGKEVLIG